MEGLDVNMAYKRVPESVLLIKNVFNEDIKAYSIRETTYLRELFLEFVHFFKLQKRLDDLTLLEIETEFKNQSMGSPIRAAKFLVAFINKYSKDSISSIIPLFKGCSNEN